jgi:hypothetical protein
LSQWQNGRQLQTQLQHLHNFIRPATQHLTTTPTNSVVINSTYQRQLPARFLQPKRPQHITTSNNTVHSGVITKVQSAWTNHYHMKWQKWSKLHDRNPWWWSTRDRNTCRV